MSLRSHLLRAAFCFFGLAAAACGEAESDVESVATETDALAAPPSDGTPEAVGVLALLADKAATVVWLDSVVGLEKRAAQNLVAHRDGLDGIRGTKDDDAFGSIAEVDATAYVGPAALNCLVAYASANGFVPEGDELLGTYDGVSFTADQAFATIAFVNATEGATLDGEVGLDRRAVQSILAARPIQTVLGLSKLAQVGKAALTKLRAASEADEPGIAPGSQGADCASTTDCNAGLRCTGFPDESAAPIGKCSPTSVRLPGQDDSCTAAAPCGSGLICAGTTVYDGAGFCRPTWMEGTFSSTASVAIPEGGAGATSSVVLYGLATVAEDVVVHVDLDHPRPQDLVVTLEHSNGSTSTLWSHDPKAGGDVVDQGLERDNSINGTLTLRVTDTVTGATGLLRGFSVRVTSRWD